MKHFISALCFVLLWCCCSSVFQAVAQDIILTKDNSIIEAIILDVSDKYVIYTPFESPGAKPETIEKVRLKKISYQDGKELDFLADSTPSSARDSVAASAPSKAIQQGIQQANYLTSLNTPVKLSNPNELRYNSGHVYNAEGQKLSMSALANYLSGKELSLYKSHATLGKISKWVGWMSFADVGVCYLIGSAMDPEDAWDSGVVIGLAAGLAGTLAGLLFWVAEDSQMEKVIKRYNSNLVTNQTCILSFGPTPNGFGLALKF